jgi:hypothetical protein
MESERRFHNAKMCIKCGYAVNVCVCEEDTGPKLIVLLLPESDPVPEELTHNFDEVPAYDNLDNEDMHFLQSVARLYMKGTEVDMERLNWFLRIRNLERRLDKMQEDIDNAE